MHRNHNAIPILRESQWSYATPFVRGVNRKFSVTLWLELEVLSKTDAVHRSADIWQCVSAYELKLVAFTNEEAFLAIDGGNEVIQRCRQLHDILAYDEDAVVAVKKIEKRMKETYGLAKRQRWTNRIKRDWW